jgi:5-methylcytosine-specific restriction endonuclease McrA
MQSVLILNATYQPLSIVGADRAIKLLISGKATALDGSGKFFNYANGSMEIPYVILLKSAIKQHSNQKPARFSRRGVMIRDSGLCVYCGNKAETIDHVLPRALGGTSTYENCVACCLTCNRKKADRPLKETGFKLNANLKPPSRLASMLDKAHRTEGAYSYWKPYIEMFDPSIATKEHIFKK